MKKVSIDLATNFDVMPDLSKQFLSFSLPKNP